LLGAIARYDLFTMHRALKLFRVGIAVAWVLVTIPAFASKTESGHGKASTKSTKSAKHAPKHAQKSAPKKAAPAKSTAKGGGAKHPKSGSKKPGKKPPAK
jgi:hypothetical protein